ncbi:MAG: hypothetical protein IPP56_06235 [Bacteroidetes bacterium]|nr:hypothetical protein [Bacteroidota bacterium]
MKKIKTSLFALLMLSAVSATLFSGCKKDKEEETVTPTPAPAPTKTELLTGKNWKVTAINCDPAIDWNGNGVMVTNIYAQLSPCGVDDITVFNTSGSYVLDAKFNVQLSLLLLLGLGFLILHKQLLQWMQVPQTVLILQFCSWMPAP